MMQPQMASRRARSPRRHALVAAGALLAVLAGVTCVSAQPLSWQLVADTSTGDAGCDPAGVTSTAKDVTLDACKSLCEDEIDNCVRIELSKLVHFVEPDAEGTFASRTDAEAACGAAGFSRLCTKAELEGAFDAAELLPPLADEGHGAASIIDAVDGTDFGAAGGEAVFSDGWVEFPGPPDTGGGERAGYVAYAFSCAAPTTVAWELSTIAPDSKANSVYLKVVVEDTDEVVMPDAGSDEAWVAWQFSGSYNSLPDFAWTSSSASFSVDAGLHTLLISEREVRRARVCRPCVLRSAFCVLRWCLASVWSRPAPLQAPSVFALAEVVCLRYLGLPSQDGVLFDRLRFALGENQCGFNDFSATRCERGWTSDWLGFWTGRHSGRCGSAGYNADEVVEDGGSGAYCCSESCHLFGSCSLTRTADLSPNGLTSQVHEFAPTPTDCAAGTFRGYRSCSAVHNHDSASPTGRTQLFSYASYGQGTPVPLTVYCDQSTAGGGWTLVASSTSPLKDFGVPHTQNLKTLTPPSDSTGLWNGLRFAVSGAASTAGDMRVSCKTLHSDADFAVDMVFEDVAWYNDVARSASDSAMCFEAGQPTCSGNRMAYGDCAADFLAAGGELQTDCTDGTPGVIDEYGRYTHLSMHRPSRWHR
jgi:hypothetical protein